jgi:vancomycin resistance protein VanJ
VSASRRPVPAAADPRPARAEKPRSSRPAARRRGSRWTLHLAQLYLGALLILWLLTRFLAEGAWWTTFLLYVPQAVYAAPALLILPLTLFRRDGRGLLVTLGCLAFVATAFMGFNVPLGRSPTPAPPGSPVVRVLSYNIRGALAGSKQIAAEVARFSPDVVIFSEASGWGRDRRIAGALDRLFPGWSRAHGGDVFIASRWPIVERDSESLAHSDERKKARAEIRAPFGTFHVVGVHFLTALYGQTLLRERRRMPRYLASAAAIRRKQARELLDWTGKLEGPVILAGDFNTPPAGRVYGALTSRFRDSFAEAGVGWGFTYSSRLPVLRIDYIFHTPDWTVERCQTGGTDGSDHLPVFAQLRLHAR